MGVASDIQDENETENLVAEEDEKNEDSILGGISLNFAENNNDLSSSRMSSQYSMNSTKRVLLSTTRPNKLNKKSLQFNSLKGSTMKESRQDINTVPI